MPSEKTLPAGIPRGTRGVVFGFLLLTVLLFPGNAEAHDISLFDVGTRAIFVLDDQEVRIVFKVQLKKFPAQTERAAADKDLDLLVTPEEARAWSLRRAKSLAENIVMKVNGAPLKIPPESANVSESFTGIVDGTLFTVTIGGSAAVPENAGQIKIEYINRNFLSERDSIVNDIMISRSKNLSDLRVYPITVIRQYRDKDRPGHVLMEMNLKRHFFIEYKTTSDKGVMEPVADNEIVAEEKSGAKTPPAGTSTGTSWMGELQARMSTLMEDNIRSTLAAGTFGAWMLLMGIALVVGVLHALGPGHGKAVVASYLIGTHGTVRDALALSVVVTFAHTLVIVAISGLMMILDHILPTEISNKALIYGSFLAGGAVVVIGIWLFFSRPDTEEDRKEAEEVDEILKETKGKSEMKRLGRIFAVGFSSGIVPCLPSLAALIICWRYGHVFKGFIVILVMSFGGALTLLGIGLLAVLGNRQVRKAGERSGGMLGRAASWLYPRMQKPMALVVVVFGLLIAWSAWGFLSRARAAGKVVLPEERKKEISLAVEGGEADATMFKELGLILALQGDLASARNQFKKALELDPEDVELDIFIGHALARDGDHKHALERYLRAAEKSHAPAEALFHAGYASQRLGDSTSASDYYGRVLERNGDDFRANFNLGVLAFENGNYARAERRFERCLVLRPENVRAERALEEARNSEGRVAFKADAYFEEDIESSPDFESALDDIRSGKENRIVRACAYLAREKPPSWKEAEPHLDKLLEGKFSEKALAAAAAILCLDPSAEVRYEESPKKLARLLWLMLTHADDSSVRWRAAVQLNELNLPSSVPAFEHSLENDESNYIRNKAAEVLGEMKAAHAVEPLCRALRNDPAADVREAAVEALGKIKVPGAFDAVASALENDSSVVVRCVSVWVLSGLDGERSVSPLIYSLLGDDDPDVRSAAARALAEVGGVKALGPLSLALRSDKDKSVRAYAAESLGYLRELDPFMDLVDAIENDEDGHVRYMAKRALENMMPSKFPTAFPWSGKEERKNQAEKMRQWFRDNASRLYREKGDLRFRLID